MVVDVSTRDGPQYTAEAGLALGARVMTSTAPKAGVSHGRPRPRLGPGSVRQHGSGRWRAREGPLLWERARLLPDAALRDDDTGRAGKGDHGRDRADSQPACRDGPRAAGPPVARRNVLGAVVSSTDAVAAGSIMDSLGVPRRAVAILEGERLVSDATALVVYGGAVRVRRRARRFRAAPGPPPAPWGRVRGVWPAVWAVAPRLGREGRGGERGGWDAWGTRPCGGRSRDATPWARRGASGADAPERPERDRRRGLATRAARPGPRRGPPGRRRGVGRARRRGARTSRACGYTDGTSATPSRPLVVGSTPGHHGIGRIA